MEQYEMGTKELHKEQMICRWGKICAYGLKGGSEFSQL